MKLNLSLYIFVESVSTITMFKQLYIFQHYTLKTQHLSNKITILTLWSILPFGTACIIWREFVLFYSRSCSLYYKN